MYWYISEALVYVTNMGMPLCDTHRTRYDIFHILK